MKPSTLLAVTLALTWLLTSCSTRSISDSEYRGDYGYYGQRSGGAYQGELSEWDVLGSGSSIPAVNEYQPVRLTPRQRLLVIQSGALFPDEQMMEQLQEHFEVVMFSGIPRGDRDAAVAERLRSAALSGGCGKLLVYWGVLEAARHDQATRTVSWVPVVGMFVPDSSQEMRIRLRAFVVDASSGRWSMVTATTFQDARWSAAVARESSDQGQVSRLKSLAYHDLVSKLL